MSHFTESLALSDYTGVLLVDAEGHGIIAAKIASTVHDTFQALILSELDHRGKTTPGLFERLNLRLAQSSTARKCTRAKFDGWVQEIEKVMLEHHQLSAKEICNALLDYAIKRDDELRQRGAQVRIDDKTVFIIKRH
jgi:hypothetical protein